MTPLHPRIKAAAKAAAIIVAAGLTALGLDLGPDATEVLAAGIAAVLPVLYGWGQKEKA